MKLPVPEAYLCPDLIPGAEPFLRCFWDLSTDRPVELYQHDKEYRTFYKRIPGSAVLTWCNTYGVSRDEIDLFVTLIQRMDDVYISIANEGGLRGQHDVADLDTLDKIFG